MSKNRNYTDYSNPQKTFQEGTEGTSSEPIVNASDVVEDSSNDEEPVLVEDYKSYDPASFKINGCELLNLRNLPNGDIIGHIKKDETITRCGITSDKDWELVKIPSGLIGYVKKDFIKEV